eukprot:PRCOL_00002720-RA
MYNLFSWRRRGSFPPAKRACLHFLLRHHGDHTAAARCDRAIGVRRVIGQVEQRRHEAARHPHRAAAHIAVRRRQVTRFDGSTEEAHSRLALLGEASARVGRSAHTLAPRVPLAPFFCKPTTPVHACVCATGVARSECGHTYLLSAVRVLVLDRVEPRSCPEDRQIRYLQGQTVGVYAPVGAHCAALALAREQQACQSEVPQVRRHLTRNQGLQLALLGAQHVGLLFCPSQLRARRQQHERLVALERARGHQPHARPRVGVEAHAGVDLGPPRTHPRLEVG